MIYIFSIIKLKIIFIEVLKRLDDPNRTVRIAALTCLTKLFDNAPDEFRHDTFKAHRELIIDTLMIHFDDNDEEVQKLAFGRHNFCSISGKHC